MIRDDPQGAGGTAVVRGGVTDGRVVAADVLGDLRSGMLLDAAFDRRAAPMDARDRRWTQELVFGTLRRRGWIDAVLDRCVRGGLSRIDPELTDVLRLGVYQLLFMGSVPPYAAIAQSVELAKQRRGIGASKLANAVLRRVDRERSDLRPEGGVQDPVEALAITHSHPRWLVARWVQRWGIAHTRQLLDANNTEPPLIVRPFGVVREQLEASLERSGVTCEDAPLVHDSVRLVGPLALTELGAFRQGMLCVQDPAATLVAKDAAFEANGVVADLCAAPGGKALELSHRAALVVAGDRAASRLGRLRENVLRLDARNVQLVAMDAREPALGMVDGVLIDVPCTGTGTLRRHPDARWRLKVSDLAVMATTQRAILESASAIVRPGGLLVYSTCSLEPEENDAPVDAFLARHPEWTLEPPPEHTVPESVIDAGRLRVLPHRHGVDGAFAVRLRRLDVPGTLAA